MDSEFKIKLVTEKDAVRFVEQMNKCNFDIDVCVDHYVIDAKSILGVIGLGIGKLLRVVGHTENNRQLEAALQGFMV